MNRSSLIGFLLFLSFMIQLRSGPLLSFYHNDFSMIAFVSAPKLVVDVHIGWLFSMLHMMGASLFMFFLLMHFLSGYYSMMSMNSGYSIISYNMGLILLILSLCNGFLGYILNWGQMSFWGMTVMMSILNSIPIMGGWCGMVFRPTYVLGISSIFCIHYLMGLLMLIAIWIHMMLLHWFSSSNPLINTTSSIIVFGRYFYKDVLYMAYWMFILSFFLFWEPDMLGNCDNNIAADPFTTPRTILPEWYYNLFYCCLSSYPNKNMGVGMVILLFVLIMI